MPRSFLRRVAFLAFLAFAGAMGVRAEIGLASVFPASGAQQACVDTPLRLNFELVPRLGASGRIRVYAADDTLVDLVDLSAAAQTKSIGGVTYNYTPVIIAGTTAHVQLHAALA